MTDNYETGCRIFEKVYIFAVWCWSGYEFFSVFAMAIWVSFLVKLN